LPTFRDNLSVPSLRVTKSDKRDNKTLADGTDKFPNVGKVVPPFFAQYSRTAQISQFGYILDVVQFDGAIEVRLTAFQLTLWRRNYFFNFSTLCI